ncbi:unnamed protein product [Closterium sp. NIES-54]
MGPSLAMAFPLELYGSALVAPVAALLTALKVTAATNAMASPPPPPPPPPSVALRTIAAAPRVLSSRRPASRRRRAPRPLTAAPRTPSPMLPLLPSFLVWSSTFVAYHDALPRHQPALPLICPLPTVPTSEQASGPANAPASLQALTPVACLCASGPPTPPADLPGSVRGWWV